jgi:P27 family predicted phage terminase small subunit
LDTLGQETWGRLIWAFEDMGMLHKVDADAVYAYCQLWSETELVKQQQDEARAGLKVLEENLSDIAAEDKVALFTQIVTLHKTVSKCTDQLRQGRMAIRQYLVEFGLTPASRGRVKLPPKREEVDDFTAFQNQRITRVK